MSNRIERGMAMRVALGLVLAITLSVGLLSAQQPDPPRKPAPDLATLDLEQLMQIEVVYAASKREQKLREAPSAVTVVTAAEIAQHGYRTVADVLRSLPSFYVSYDRNYSYVGVRGFSRPGDYNSRVLMLVDGLRLNDNVYDMAFVDDEFPIDMDLIDRIEVVRGPSAAIYGSSAFFAVINVMTKRGTDLQGGEVAGSAASFGNYGGRVSYGRSVPSGLDVLLSASYDDAAGPSRLYFREYDDPATNGGIAEGADDETARRLLASLSKGPFVLQGTHVYREKGVPTGAYETAFNDSRTRTVDAMTLASLAYSKTSAEGSSLGARLHFGHWYYHGEYSYDFGLPPNQDYSTGEAWGIDLDGSRTLFMRHLVTLGLEYRDNYRQDQWNYDPDPYYASYLDERHGSKRLGLFAQDEIKLGTTLTLHAGVRVDWYDTFGSATSPRLALIYLPNEAMTVKLLYGHAFRAPNEYELHFSGLIYKTNPSLQPERIETAEVVAERLIGRRVRLTAAGFRNRISDLVNLMEDPADSLLVFTNAGRIDSDGLELGLDVNRGYGVTGRLSYALQGSRDHETGIELTNSPRHMAKLQLRAPLHGSGISAGVDAQYLSSRLTLGGGSAKGYTVTNLSLLAPNAIGRLGLSASIYNLFDARYGNPGSEEHAQDVIEQDGRSFRVKATLHF
jgi:outer membrane receptor for ferrienterochelin and colicins